MFVCLFRVLAHPHVHSQVRGGSFAFPVFEDHVNKTIDMVLKHMEGTCFKCGSVDHLQVVADQFCPYVHHCRPPVRFYDRIVA